ncbi:MAG: hypothetical protein L6N96_05305 [Candidatus Methylarchaceae archaeon HK02M2]|nr:hypothetical protein [Candidatus Methylarchaceae archaeon HK02M2]
MSSTTKADLRRGDLSGANLEETYLVDAIMQTDYVNQQTKTNGIILISEENR